MKTPNHPLLLLSVALCFSWAPPVRAQSAVLTPPGAPKQHYAPHFAKPTSVDCAHLLPPPPAQGSLSGRADLEAVLQAQRWRSAEQIAWAVQVDKNDPFLSSMVLGVWFKKENLPATASFLKDIDEDRHEITEVAKTLFARARPWVVDQRVNPCVPKPRNDSYPSGHASSIFTRAEILATLFPEKRAELFEFAHRAVWGRVFAGVHYPSDLIGGEILAEAIAIEIKKSPLFQQRVEAVQREIGELRRKAPN